MMRIAAGMFAVFFTIQIIELNALPQKELRWQWDKINTENITFPKDFLWGVAMSEFQNSGATNCPKCNWADRERCMALDKKFCTKRELFSGTACDSLHRWKEDIECAKALGINALRFSIEWSLIEPEEGVFDEIMLAHYREFTECLIANGIKPMITLHHFTNPTWFEKMGAFEKQENIKYFVRFCAKMFETLHDKISLWTTINEPGVYVFQTYIHGVWPPEKAGCITLGARVLRNLLRAHVATYNKLKSMEGGDKVQIGIVHNITQFDPYDPLNPLQQATCWYMNHIFYKAALDFFRTGVFAFYGTTAKVIYKNPQGPKSIDFFGLNYYSHILMSMTGPAYRDGDVPTDMPYGIYAEGLYRAIKEVSALKVPIYITENGIADAKDDRRAHFIKQYTYAVFQAIKDGCDVRGYFYWSLLDNFEWNLGWPQKFGLYAVDFDTKQRTLRKGAQAYIDLVKKQKESL